MGTTSILPTDNKIILSQSGIISFFIFIILVCISSFRSFNVGTDTLDYVTGFLYPDLSIQNRNIGYNVFVSIVRVFSTNPRFFLVIVSLFTQILIYRYLVKYSKQSIFSILLYTLIYFCFSLNILRQFIVIAAFYYWGIDFILQRKWIKFFVLIGILATFHELSIALIPLYFCANRLLAKSKYFFIWLISLAFLLTSQIGSISAMLSNIDYFLRLLFSNLPNYFSEVDSLTKGKSSFNGLIFDQLVFLVVYQMLFYSGKVEQTKSTILFFNIFFIGIILQNVFFLIETVQRVALLFLFALPAVASNTIFKIYYKIIYIIVLSILFYYRFVLNGIAGVF